ncbi:cell division protein FtsN [Acidovorax delafieldii]|uniref:Cell division protein FtsN n=1 Tax=Acidovorax delafieldii TaxID=47920 RepID=A0A561XHW9_ACIDE|nr:SPOR domain-containing protein [Acidovorax delafieldii]TWG35721.1 cell division protein FtsN [Acidovorax delafieldii]
MLDHTDPVASIIPAMSLDLPSDNAMAAMSRLALGPVNTDYYLKVFERFDDTGRTTTTWNWAACLCTLNWMLFRQLWGAALVYVAAAEGLALIVFGVGRSFLHWPVGIELGVLGAFAVLAFAVPGLYGNAILYADIRKRIARALAASRTVPEACALLEKQASSRKRLQVLVLANVVLGLAALIAYLALSPSDVKPLALEPAVTVAQATAAAQAASATKPVGALPVPETEGATTPPTPAPEVATEPPPAPLPATTPAPQAPAAAAAPKPALAPAPVASAPLAVAPAPAATAVQKTAEPPAPALSASATAAPPAAKASTPKPATPAASTRAPTPAASATATAPARRDAASRAAAPTKPKTPAAAASSTADTALPTVGTAPGYYINVGLFAEEANARKTQARLLNEGLPAFRQELNNSKGRRIRVRVGPYATRAQADAAAEAIRAMALDAVVFKQ